MLALTTLLFASLPNFTFRSSMFPTRKSAMMAIFKPQNHKLKNHDFLFYEEPFNLIRLYESHSVVSDSLRSHELYSPWNSPGQNTGVGSPYILQGIFPTQGIGTEVSHNAGGYFTS